MALGESGTTAKRPCASVTMKAPLPTRWPGELADGVGTTAGATEAAGGGGVAAVEVARLGVWMLNVHASGGAEMMRRTVESVGEFCDKDSLEKPLIIAVTVLTSSNRETLREIGTWGPRPKAAMDYFLEMRESGLEKPQMMENLQRWYNSDKNQAIQAEFEILFEESFKNLQTKAVTS